MLDKTAISQYLLTEWAGLLTALTPRPSAAYCLCKEDAALLEEELTPQLARIALRQAGFTPSPDDPGSFIRPRVLGERSLRLAIKIKDFRIEPFREAKAVLDPEGVVVT